MMPQSLETPWIRRTKWLTQALIISGTLNIGLVSTFIYFVVKERDASLIIEKPIAKEIPATVTNIQLLSAYSLLPYQELILRLENKELMEEGLTRRDLALSCLIAFHHFHLEGALGSFIPQKRQLLLSIRDQESPCELSIYPGLTDSQFQAILQYARTEKWPLTPKGLFLEFKRTYPQTDPTLIEALSFAAEYRMLQALFSKTGIALAQEDLLALLHASAWEEVSPFADSLRQTLDFVPETRRSFLLSLLPQPTAARLLVHHDLEYALKRLGDAQILAILDSLNEKTSELNHFALELLSSPRTDPVWHKAAAYLYASVGEEPPIPYDHAVVLKRFLPQSLSADLLAQSKEAIKQSAPQRFHTVAPGDSLWKLSRKYKVSIEEIMRVNHLETERLRLGKQLEIPEESARKN